MRNDVLRIIEELTAFYEDEPNDARIESWATTFEQYDYQTLKQAADECQREYDWFPKLPKFRAAVRKYADQYHNRQSYWRAMDVLSVRLRGQITDDELEADRAWRWYEQHAQHEDESLVWQVQEVEAQ